MAAVCAVLESGHLVQGDEVDRFEKELAGFIGVKSAVAVSSGTTALHLSLLALRIGPGDEVVIPSFVCTALLNAVRLVGATPVLTDIDADHFNLDVGDVKRRITSRTKALILPHMFGQAADLEEALALGLPVIEDCAQSLGSRYCGSMTGSFGILAVFSFYATKVIATGEGGMVVSNHSELMDVIRDLRDYDERDDDLLRYNYKMTDIQASLGRSQLRQLPVFLDARKMIACRYDRAIEEMGIPVSPRRGDRDHIFYRYILRHKQAASLLQSMGERGISCRHPIYRPLHHYLNIPGFPVSEQAWRETLSIPIYPSLTEGDIVHIVSSLKNLLGKGA
jgi:dTDP-4-amino-4,6-dideoxygalactose transaminase